MTTTNGKFLHFLNSAKYYLVLILLLIIVIIWHYGKMYFLEKSTEKEKVGIVADYERKLDSVKLVQLQLTAKAFSWAIRSELIRGNHDQINQYFNEFIKTPGISKLQLVNATNSVIEISTDKKDEGSQNADYYSIKGQETIMEASALKIVTPISGVNGQMGVFILSVNNFFRTE